MQQCKRKLVIRKCLCAYSRAHYSTPLETVNMQESITKPEIHSKHNLNLRHVILNCVSNLWNFLKGVTLQCMQFVLSKYCKSYIRLFMRQKSNKISHFLYQFCFHNFVTFVKLLSNRLLNDRRSPPYFNNKRCQPKLFVLDSVSRCS